MVCPLGLLYIKDKKEGFAQQSKSLSYLVAFFRVLPKFRLFRSF
jgi:hypothetical protein